MKICVIFSSCEGSDRECRNIQDPSTYTDRHEFIRKSINQSNAEEELDEICISGEYDMYWSFLSDMKALKYLDSKNEAVIGSSSKFVAMTRLYVKKLILGAEINTPKWRVGSEKNIQGLKFPVIVKPLVGWGNLTQDSICLNEDQLKEHVESLGSSLDVLIEEYIVGDEMSMTVVETEDGAKPLPPIIYNFPPNLKPNQKNRFVGCKIGSEEITYKIYDDDLSTLKKIQETGVRAYEGLGVNGSGYATVNFRISSDKEIYVLGVNPRPAFFGGLGCTFADDFGIEHGFPGGHPQLIETIIKAKEGLHKRNKFYDSFSGSYDQIFVSSGFENSLKGFIQNFEFGGSVLDVGCGSGTVGRMILAKHPKTNLFGIDASSEMAKLAKASNYVSVEVGLAENIIMELTECYDHVISSSMLQFIDPRNFMKILNRMFCVAKTSISLCIDDIKEEYSDIQSKLGDDGIFCTFSHVKTLDQFQPPSDWVLVHREYGFLWESTLTKIQIHGLLIRFEKTTKNK